MAQPKMLDADLSDVRSRYSKSSDYWGPAFDRARDDINFVTVPGHQWDPALRQRRGDRPCYEFQKLASHTRQVINEMRQTRPQGKVRGVGDGDQGLADIMQGVCRNIESVSNAEQAYDIAYEKAVKGGFGVWRICTDYINDDDFEQDIRIKPIRNPFSVKFDPAATEIDRRDARFCFVEELIATSEFERKYPKADVTDFFEDRSCSAWREGNDKVRIAEYWWKQPEKRVRVAITRNGNPVPEIVWADELGPEAGWIASGITVIQRRTVDTHRVYMRLTNGHEWLTERYEFPSKFIPIVPVWGNIEDIDGEDYWQGMVRPAKDQQRLHNMHRTAAIEAVAKAPKAPFILKMKWIKGLERFWNRANAEDYPYLPVADDTPDTAMPQRTQQAEVPAALIQLAAMDNEDIKATTGQFNPSLGAQSNASSGRAINSLKMSGATATFNYIDNLVYAIKYTYEILVDMIPRVYDTPRVVRLLGPDGGEKWKQLYMEVVDPDTGQRRTVNDVSKGKYDVTVTVGPAYATQRLEAAEGFMQLLGQIGPTLPQPLVNLLAYTTVKNMDVPGAEEVTEPFRKMLVQMGVMPPKDGEEPPAPQQPSPEQVAQLRALIARAMKDEATANKTNNEAQAVIPQAQADIANTQAKTADQEVQNLLAAARFMSVVAPPPPSFIEIEPRPPQGGFSFGAPAGVPQLTG